MKIGKILSGSFIIIMLIHILVFTAIGALTPLGWRLLLIFAYGLAGLGVVWAAMYLYFRRSGTPPWALHIPFMKKALDRQSNHNKL